MNISLYLSEKIKVISLVLIILVLYIHSGFHANEIENMSLNLFVQQAIGGVLGRLAVPFFFIISGFLYFKNYHDISFSFLKKIRSRISSLLIPYIIGCLFVLLWICALVYLPVFGEQLNDKYSKIFIKAPLNLIRSIFLFNDGSYSPIPYHLWFLRDLIFIVFLSPILIYFIKFLKWYFIIILVITISFLIAEPFFISILYFSIGATLNFSLIDINFKNSNKWLLLIIAAYVIISFIELYMGIFNKHPYKELPILVGVVGVWITYDIIIPDKFRIDNHKGLKFISKYTFFTYVFHSPTINVFRKSIVKLIGNNEIGYLFSYLFSPIICIILFSFIGYFLNKHLPKVYSVIVGGRT